MKHCKLFALIALVLALVAVSVFALADGQTTLKLEAPNGVGTTCQSQVTAKGLTATEKTYYPARGSTVNEWTWYDTSETYVMNNGTSPAYLSYKIRGNYFYVTVESGSSWLKLIKDSGFGNWHWVASDNYTRYTRAARIRVYDKYGTICYVNVRQAGKTELMSVTRVGKRIRIQYVGVTGLNGNIIYFDDDSSDDWNWRPVKYTHASIWYHDNRPLGHDYYYKVAQYRCFAGKTVIGPSTDWDTVYLPN